MRARIELPNPGGQLNPGMLVNVALVAPRTQDAVVVPQEAVIATGKRSVVIVREADGRFRPVDVVVGRDLGSDVEITPGPARRARRSSPPANSCSTRKRASRPRCPDSTAAREHAPPGNRRPAVIAGLIRWSVRNRLLVLLAAAGLGAWGVWAVLRAPLDALPDLSDVQVIVRVQYPGQAPQIIEDQVTYPLTTTMLSVPGAKVVRGFSFFGDAFVYVLFDDGTDPYWARTRVLEYLNQVQSRLPAGAKVSLGPDATGVGWIYEYALVDRTGKQDLSELRALQDWFLKYELKAIPDVAEVASIGGMVRQFQVVVDPDKLVAFNLPLSQVVAALQRSNREAGGSVIELGEAEYMVRARGLPANRWTTFAASSCAPATQVFRSCWATWRALQLGPEMRRGIAELNGEGEVAGGVVVLRSGKNALSAIRAVQARLEELKSSLPAGVEIVHDLRPLAADRARGGEPARQARRGVHRRGARLPRVPAARALGAGRHHLAAAGGAGLVRRHALPGSQRQHHVAGRHRDRHRRDGRRGRS